MIADLSGFDWLTVLVLSGTAVWGLSITFAHRRYMSRVPPVGTLPVTDAQIRDAAHAYAAGIAPLNFQLHGHEIIRLETDGTLVFVEDGDAMTPEGKVKKRVKDMLSAFGAGVWYTSPLTAGFGNSGTPDILACCWGHFLAIECKAGNNTVTALQQQEIDRIVAAGGEALVINEHNMEVLAVVLAAWNPQNEQA